MNPQKNQGADDAPLLRDLQLEVSQESAPLLQFMLRHAGLIAGVLVLFLLVLIGTGIYNWHGDSRAEEARDALARTLIQNQGADQVKALSQLAEGAPSSTRFAAYMALAHSALENGDYATAAQAYGKAAKSTDGAFSLSASLGEAGALLKAGKNAEALTMLQSLAGKEHDVFSAVAVLCPAGAIAFAVHTKVRMAAASARAWSSSSRAARMCAPRSVHRACSSGEAGPCVVCCSAMSRTRIRCVRLFSAYSPKEHP